jgi:hypothetical protein
MFGLIFSGHSVPILYSNGGSNTEAALRPYQPTLYFTTTDCSGTPRLNDFQIKDVGFGAFNLVVNDGSSTRIFAFSGQRDTSSTTFVRWIQNGTCQSVSNTSTGYYQLQNVTAQLPAVPSTIPFGYRLSNS